MKPETEQLLHQCRTALLQQSNEQLNTLFVSWFERLVGEESMDEALDDLCLLLGYGIRSLHSHILYATYTAWWEVEAELQLRLHERAAFEEPLARILAVGDPIDCIEVSLPVDGQRARIQLHPGEPLLGALQSILRVGMSSQPFGELSSLAGLAHVVEQDEQVLHYSNVVSALERVANT